MKFWPIIHIAYLIGLLLAYGLIAVTGWNAIFTPGIENPNELAEGMLMGVTITVLAWAGNSFIENRY